MPDEETRLGVVKQVAPRFEPAWQKRLSEVTAGLKSVQIQSVLGPTPHGAEDPTARPSARSSS